MNVIQKIQLYIKDLEITDNLRTKQNILWAIKLWKTFPITLFSSTLFFIFIISKFNLHILNNGLNNGINLIQDFFVFFGVPLILSSLLANLNSKNKFFKFRLFNLFSDYSEIQTTLDEENRNQNIVKKFFSDKTFTHSMLEFYELLSVLIIEQYSPFPQKFDELNIILSNNDESKFIKFFLDNFLNDFESYYNHPTITKFLTKRDSDYVIPQIILANPEPKKITPIDNSFKFNLDFQDNILNNKVFHIQNILNSILENKLLNHEIEIKTQVFSIKETYMQKIYENFIHIPLNFRNKKVNNKSPIDLVSEQLDLIISGLNDIENCLLNESITDLKIMNRFLEEKFTSSKNNYLTSIK